MERTSIKVIVATTTVLIILVVTAYFLGVGVVGGAKFSFNAKDWVDFSSYFNGMLSPFLAALAAAIAFFSLSHQMRISRQDSSLNEQIANYLNNIKLLQAMIDKRWVTVIKVTQTDWETEPFYAINKGNIKESLVNSVYLSPEMIVLFRLLEDLVDAVQGYTYLHKLKIDLNQQSFPKNEWSHFSISLIREQDKKMRYCYQYCLWVLEEPNEYYEKYQKELLIYRQFYENLKSEGTLFEP